MVVAHFESRGGMYGDYDQDARRRLPVPLELASTAELVRKRLQTYLPLQEVISSIALAQDSQSMSASESLKRGKETWELRHAAEADLAVAQTMSAASEGYPVATAAADVMEEAAYTKLEALPAKLPDELFFKMIGPYQQTGMNVYDQRKKCEVPPLCYDFSPVTTWLNSADVQTQLGVNKKWASCDFGINFQFQGDWMQRYDTKLVDLLASGVRVLIYAGDCDFICNWLGNKHWTLKLDWAHSAEFNAAADEPFNVNGKEAGRLRTANGFSFLQVYQAGHMVPMDQPEVAVEMLNLFINDKLDASPELVV